MTAMCKKKSELLGLSMFERDVVRPEIQALQDTIITVKSLPDTDKLTRLLETLERVKGALLDTDFKNHKIKCLLVQKMPLLYIQVHKLRKEIA